MMYAALGPERFRPSKYHAEYPVRLSDDLRKSVVFIGEGNASSFSLLGTGFWVSFGGYTYLVTAKHVVVKNRSPDFPFVVKFNRIGGDAVGLNIDPATHGPWFFHPDADVDVAVMPVWSDFFDSPLRLYDIRMNPADAMVGDKWMDIIGNGDLCYTVGLFHFLVGSKKIVPVVHSGNIALLAEGERIPAEDWDNPRNESRMIEAHLVDQRSLKGLSGAPVYVRPVAFNKFRESEDYSLEPMFETLLLGLFQGTWYAKPDEILSMQFHSPRDAQSANIGVGMGLVVPAQKIREVLEMDEMKVALQQDHHEREMENVSKSQGISRPRVEANAGDEVLQRMLNTPPKKDG